MRNRFPEGKKYMQKVTIRDVADVAKVSTTTVSHVINKTRFVEKPTEQRVLKAINELGYMINGVARGLRSGRTNIIGLVLPDVSNPFFAEFARLIEDYGFETGYTVILCNSDNHIDKQRAYLNLLISTGVDGIIYISSGGDNESIDMLKKHHMPFVFADRELPEGISDTVLIDNEQGGYDATCHLIGRGHCEIACIIGPDNLAPSMDRQKGYMRALEDHGIRYNPDLVIKGNFDIRSGTDAFELMYARSVVPTAVFATNDMMAIGWIEAAQRRGYLIPNDISVVGFDNIQLSSLISPSLTTVAQPIEAISHQIIDLIIKRISTSDVIKASRIVLKTSLIIRESSGMCKKGGIR